MKKTLKITAITLVCALALSSLAALGSSIAKQVDIYFRNIVININGDDIQPKNADGETVEPFIYDGTVYLPVRAVAEAVGMDVSWDDKTSTVTLKDKVQDGTDVTEDVPEKDEKLYNGVEFYNDIEAKLEKVMPKEELDKEVLMNIEGVPFSAAAVRYAVLASASYHENPEDEETKKIIEQEIKDYFLLNAAVVLKAKELGVDVSDEKFNKDYASVYNEMKASYGDSFKEIIETYTFQTTYYYFLNQYFNGLYNEIFAKVMEDDAFSQTVKAKTLAELENAKTPYIRAKHLLVAFGENDSDVEKKEKFDKATELYERAKKGEHFDALIKEYGEDPGMTVNAGGYYFTTGEMVKPFEDTAFALKEGEISQPVETDFGYHIIQRLPLDDDAIKSTQQYWQTGSQLLDDILRQQTKELEIYYASNYEERCADFKK